MVFSSLQFIFIFLPAFLLVYYLVPDRWRNTVLFAGSMAFYLVGAWHEPIYVVFLLIAVLFNYFCGILLEGGKYRKFWLIVGLVFDLGWLFVFKYADFLIGGINRIIHAASATAAGIQTLNLTLPIGISFYTFQSVSYLIDVYRGDVHAESNFINYGAYLTMFPQLIAGPIVKYQTVQERLQRRNYSFFQLVDGFKVFICGLGLKVLLANRLAGLWGSMEAIGYDYVSTPLAWCGILAYTFEIYFDFFGYSLMAIGLGRMLGFEFPQNFNHPYLSLSMTEFWRRWHMTLGSWFRDYVYIPLGGNRCSRPRMYFNLFVVWALTGLWHGAHMNFVLWGLVTFVLIAIEKAGWLDILERHRWAGHLYMFFVLAVMWSLFAITDFHDIGHFLARLFPIFGHFSTGAVHPGADFGRLFRQYWVFLLLGFCFSTQVPYRLYEKVKDNIIGTAFLLAVFWGSVYCIYKGMNDPFLYFRF
ncbi:MAG: MBOAT family protein [Oscillospiraceae bacterium]|nr:MBOAT family protein [Oscillospiraceae bacterium]